MDPFSALLLTLAALAAGFWIFVLADRGRRWPAGAWLEPAGTASGRRAAEADVVVLVPARNEAAMLPETLPALLAQEASFSRLAVVDDRSEDGTATAARGLIRACGLEGKARVVEAPPPPPGWSGKLHALQAGLASLCRDRASSPPRWLLFTDADIRHAPGTIDALRALAEEEGYDLVSVMARLRARSFWEKLLIPPFVCFFQLLYPFRRVASERSRVAAAAGGCILIDRALLEALGGLEALRGAVIDDVELARRAKAHGGRLWLGLSGSVESLRRYERLSAIVAMVSRTAFTQLRSSYGLLALTITALGVLVAAPPWVALVAALRREWLASSLALLAWLLEASCLLPAARHHGLRAPWSLTLPAASLAYAWATALSAWNHARGRGVRWRGRTWKGA